MQLPTARVAGRQAAPPSSRQDSNTICCATLRQGLASYSNSASCPRGPLRRGLRKAQICNGTAGRAWRKWVLYKQTEAFEQLSALAKVQGQHRASSAGAHVGRTSESTLGSQNCTAARVPFAGSAAGGTHWYCIQKAGGRDSKPSAYGSDALDASEFDKLQHHFAELQFFCRSHSSSSHIFISPRLGFHASGSQPCPTGGVPLSALAITLSPL